MAIKTLEEFNAKVDTLPDAEKLALKLVNANAVNGSMWAIHPISKVSDFGSLLEDSSKFVVYTLNEDKVLVAVNPDFFGHAMQMVDPEMAQNLKGQFFENKVQANEGLIKRIKKFVTGFKKTGANRLTLGIYSVNASPNATASNGERIPAYQVTFSDLSRVLLDATQQSGVNFNIEIAFGVSVAPTNTLPAWTSISDVELCRDDNAWKVTISAK